MLQVVMQTQNTDTKILRNAAVLQWHKDTQEEARLARYARQTARPLVATHVDPNAHVYNVPVGNSQQGLRPFTLYRGAASAKYTCLNGTQVLLVLLG